MKIKNFVLFLILYDITTPILPRENNNNTIQSKNLALAAIAGIIGYTTYNYINTPHQPNIHEHNFSEHPGNFPADFAWGVATSSTQNEDDLPYNTWSASYLKEVVQENIIPATWGCKSYTCSDDDIEKLVHLGVNSYRFSIEWSRVNPELNTFNEQAIQHYVDFTQKLQAAGIKPLVCFHHYSDPAWFLHEGGFSKKENIAYFLTYCQKVYQALRPYVEQWIVISQPAAYAIKGYDQAIQPPFLKSGLSEQVLLNLFIAHIHVYDMMHEDYATNKQGLKPEIGICHQISQMQPYTSYSPLDHVSAMFADRIYNKAVLRFFRNGHLRGLKPLFDIAYIPEACKKFDFFALSYYCPKGLSGFTPVTPKALPTHQTADTTRIIDKDGMYNALVQAASLGKPVYVVESGIDPIDEKQRILLLDSYLSAIHEALRQGIDVRGYYYWTLMDNYEWGKAYNSTHFGLYKNRVCNEQGDICPEYQNHELMLKDGGKHYKKIIARHTNNKNNSTTHELI